MSDTVFPLFARLDGRHILVVGGGEIAERKIRLILRSGARIHAVARDFSPALRELGRNGEISLQRGEFTPAMLDGIWLVIAATDDRAANENIADACAARHLFVNVVDDARLSTVQIPALVDRSPLMVAISSSGCAPMIARSVRERLEALLDPALGQLTSLAQANRGLIASLYPDLSARRAFYEDLLRGPVPELLRSGRAADARRAFAHMLERPAGRPSRGWVCSLVANGADPGNLTLNGLRALNLADVIHYDRACHPGFLELARRDAGRAPFDATALGRGPDDAVLRAIAQAAGKGRNVVIMQVLIPDDELRSQADFFAGRGIDFNFLPGVGPHALCQATPVFGATCGVSTHQPQ